MFSSFLVIPGVDVFHEHVEKWQFDFAEVFSVKTNSYIYFTL